MLTSAMVIIALGVLFLMFTNRGRRICESIKDIYYGAYLPLGNVYGIDVSHFQGRIDWREVGQIHYNSVTRRIRKDGVTSHKISFAIAKATEGSSSKYDDVDYSKNYQAIRKTKLKLGAYHVLTPAGKFQEQAVHFIETANLRSGDIRPILDVEAGIRLKGKDLITAVQEWVAVVEQYYKCKPIIYTSASLYSSAFATKDFEEYDFWIAQYYSPLMVKAKVWQFTERGQVRGIKGRVDLNVLPNSEKGLEHLLIP